MQIWAAFCLAILASGTFTDFKINTNFFQLFIFDNFVVSSILGVLGLFFFRYSLRKIESMVKSQKN